MVDVAANRFEHLASTYDPETTANTDALANIFADVAYWGCFSSSTLEHARTLRQNGVPFAGELLHSIAELAGKPPTGLEIPSGQTHLSAQQHIVTSGIKAMGYGNLHIEPGLLEAAAKKVDWTMEYVRLTLVPSPGDLIAIAREQGRLLPYAERAELSSNTRRALIRCGGDRYFNNLMIRLYNPNLLAKTMVKGLAYDLHLAAGS